jgi:hypothetical protein
MTCTQLKSGFGRRRIDSTDRAIEHDPAHNLDVLDHLLREVRTTSCSLGAALERDCPQFERNRVPCDTCIVGDPPEQIRLGVHLDVDCASHIDDWADHCAGVTPSRGSLGAFPIPAHNTYSES